MKVAVLSDVHGNLAGLEAVLSAIDDHTPDDIVVAGDLCMIGPRPAACLETIRSRRLRAIYGNTDEWLLGRQTPPEHLQAAAHWTAEQLSTEQKDWLTELPFHLRYSPTGNKMDDLLIVHANPLDVNRIIFPPEEQQQSIYGRIRQPDSELAPLVTGLKAAVLAYGHLHIPNVRMWGDIPLVNISSISLPGDGDPRAKFALFTWDGRGWHFEHFRVPYDLEDEVEAHHQNPIPGWEEALQTLETNRFISQRV